MVADAVVERRRNRPHPYYHATGKLAPSQAEGGGFSSSEDNDDFARAHEQQARYAPSRAFLRPASYAEDESSSARPAIFGFDDTDDEPEITDEVASTGAAVAARQQAHRAALYASVVDEPGERRLRRKMATAVLQRMGTDGDKNKAQTAGEARLRQVLAEPFTPQDEEQAIQKDNVFMTTTGVPPPETMAFIHKHGERKAADKCWACEAKLFSGNPMPSQVIKEISDYVTQNFYAVEFEAFCEQLHTFYNRVRKKHEERVQRHAREQDARFLAEHEGPMPEWSVACIHEHFTLHTQIPEFVVPNDVRELSRIQRHLLHNAVHRINTLRPGKTHTNEPSIKTYQSILKQKTQLMTIDTTRMRNSHAGLAAASKEAHIFSPQTKCLIDTTTVKDIFA